ncbi:hypothetical protein ES708_33464 [subsurface metagenome]
MLKKVDTKEIRNIKERLESELEDKNLLLQRKEEAISLLYHLSNWLEWRDYQEKKAITRTKIYPEVL